MPINQSLLKLIQETLGKINFFKSTLSTNSFSNLTRRLTQLVAITIKVDKGTWF